NPSLPRAPDSAPPHPHNGGAARRLSQDSIREALSQFDLLSQDFNNRRSLSSTAGLGSSRPQTAEEPPASGAPRAGWASVVQRPRTSSLLNSRRSSSAEGTELEDHGV